MTRPSRPALRRLRIPHLSRPHLGRPHLGRRLLRTQVLAGVLLVTIVALAAFDAAAVSALRRYLLNRTDTNLSSVLHLARQVTLPPGGGGVRLAGPPPAHRAAQRISIAGPHLRKLPRFLDQYYLAYIKSSGPAQVFVRGNPDLVPRRVHALAGLSWIRVRTVRSGHGNLLRLSALRVPGGVLVASTSMSEVNKTVGRLRLILIIGSAAAALLVAGGVILVLRRGLRPIETMAAEADRISAGDLTDRVSERDPRTEVGRLGTALNGMLTRIETTVAERAASQEMTRRFFADASHELRTPLASLRANAELYQQGALRTKPEVDEAMRRITLEARRMGKLVDDMLRLARLDQLPGQDSEPVDLSALVAGCAERAQVASEGRAWRVHVQPGLATAGDEELLRRAVDNLLANVCAHTPPEATGTVTAARDGSAVVIEVSDDGPGVPASRLPHIFDRFYRAAPAACPGSGLGLAIVAAIAATHHGTAAAGLNSPHGLRVTVSLPALAGQELAGTRPAAREPAELVS